MRVYLQKEHGDPDGLLVKIARYLRDLNVVKVFIIGAKNEDHGLNLAGASKFRINCKDRAEKDSGDKRGM